ncbi:uncharacterized protein MONBRDRAFT_29736 [Monosiga brevicollis MX1]|uniref:FYVE-type domain-containing protein n=1 Tax=Monosiga brevicollis TaxID=81824 RepID=A9VBZ3_MONBE|nr:uncharacterized protein MONBRDRAFT_29736 [Monosiga brevicollis MX1]EDQ84889.1 predicted protein [Monosiga brevicollis MX1]|eukprot:XP_001750230.1 hypothetical protein [Monosiga brevicollis MX1]
MEVAAGFVCPSCFKDLGNLESLEKHFAAGCKGPSAGKTGPGTKGNRLAKLLKLKSADDETAPGALGAAAAPNPADDPAYLTHVEFEPQTIDFERNIIPWVDGKIIKACPECGKKFSLTRRQHHCRLCGSVLCDDCSLALEANVAIALTVPPELPGKKQRLSHEQKLTLLRESLVIPGEVIRICPFCHQSLHTYAIATASVFPICNAANVKSKCKQPQYPITGSSSKPIRATAAVGSYESVAEEFQAISADLLVIEKQCRVVAGAIKKEDADKFPSSLRLHAAITQQWRTFIQMTKGTRMTLPPLADVKKIALEREKARQEAEERERQLRLQQQREREQAEKEAAAIRARRAARKEKEPRRNAPTPPTAAAVPVNADTLMLIREQRTYIMRCIKDARRRNAQDEVNMLQAQLQELEVIMGQS